MAVAGLFNMSKILPASNDEAHEMKHIHLTIVLLVSVILSLCGVVSCASTDISRGTVVSATQTPAFNQYAQLITPGSLVPSQPTDESPATISAPTLTLSPPPPESDVDSDLIRSVAGFVVEGGDTTPEELIDIPREFVYKIETDDGAIYYIKYVAYPPSPFGDGKSEIELDFHAGEILIGDYVEARGSFDAQTNTVIVGGDGSYIRTYLKKPAN